MSRSAPLLALAVSVLGWLVAGCGSSESRSPALESCAECKVQVPGTSNGGGGAGSGGAGGSAGSSGSGAGMGGAAGGQAKSVSLTGSIAAITSADLIANGPYAGAVVIGAKAIDGSETTAKATSNYLLPDVASGPQWISTKPVAVDALGTLTFATVPSKDSTLDLVVVRNEALTSVLGTLPKPTTLTPLLAHAIVFFRTPEGLALAATKLTPSFTAEVGHDDGPGYGGVETHGRGIAVLFNAKPSAAAQATVEHAGSKATVTLPLAADQVTMVAITLQP